MLTADVIGSVLPVATRELLETMLSLDFIISPVSFDDDVCVGGMTSQDKRLEMK